MPCAAEMIFDAECGMRVATCEDLSVATEAPSYEVLTACVWEIAPEIAEMNGLAFDANTRIQFHHLEDAAPHHRAAM